MAPDLPLDFERIRIAPSSSERRDFYVDTLAAADLHGVDDRPQNGQVILQILRRLVLILLLVGVFLGRWRLLLLQVVLRLLRHRETRRARCQDQSCRSTHIRGVDAAAAEQGRRCPRNPQRGQRCTQRVDPERKCRPAQRFDGGIVDGN